jgi:CubicO group peptidase (beta-lactamase class C family)
VGLERGDFLFRFTGYDAAEVIRRMRLMEERQPFRATMTYHNVGYAAAGEAAAAAAGMSWADLVRTRLLEPLGMRDTTAGVEHTLAPNHVTGHATIAGVHRPIRNKKALNTNPAGGVNSTARDIARWMIFHLGDGTWEGRRVISAEAMNEMHSPQVIIPTTPAMREARGVEFFGGYGLGWNIMDFRGHPMLWHSGGADGQPTYLAILPKDKIGVAVFVNTWEAPVLHGSIASRIIDTLLGVKDKRDWAGDALEAHRRNVQRGLEQYEELMKSRVEGTTPSRPLDSYAGTYENKLHGTMTVGHEDGKLTLQFAKGVTGDLTHWNYDTFRVTWHDRTYEFLDTFATFTLDRTGKPVRMEMPLGPRDTIVATR